MPSPSTIRRPLLGAALLLTLSCGGGEGGTEPNPYPAPVIAAISRDTATSGVTPFGVTLSGSGFVSGAVGLFDGAERTTAFQGTGQITFQLLASDLATPGDHQVTAKNPDPTVGPSEVRIFHVLPVPPLPVLDSLSPDTVIANELPELDLKVFGHGFALGAKIRMNGTAVPTTTRVSDTLLTTHIVGGILGTPGSVTIDVFKAGPGGGTSASRSFTILPVPPPPAITSLAPTSMRTGGTTQTLHIYGNGFTPATVIQFNTVNLNSTPAVTFVADTEVTVQVPLAQLTTKKFAMVSLPGAGTYKTLTLLPPHVVVTAISPDSAGLGDHISFTARGSAFVPPGDDYSNTLVRWRGIGAFVDSLTDTTLFVTIPHEEGLAGGVISVAFVNQGDTDTAYASFTITRPVPVITALSPPSDTTGPAPRTLFGRAFGIDSTVQVYVNGVLRPSAGHAPYPNETEGYFSAQLSAGEAASPGPIEVKLVNLSPGGGTSAPDTMWLVAPNPVPVIDSITPGQLTTGTGRSIVVKGHGFVVGMTAVLNGAPVPIGYVDAGTATLTIPDSLTADAGRLTVGMRNPAPTPDNYGVVTVDVRTPDVESVSTIAGWYNVIRGDTLRHRLYATIPAEATGGPALHVLAGDGSGVLASLPIPGDVRDIAVSAGAQYLYATVPATRQVLRYDLGTLTLDRSWFTFAAPGDTLPPYHLAPSPTVPTTVAVFTGPGTTNGYDHVAIFDDTLRRPHLADLLGSYVGVARWASDSEIALLQLTGPSPWYIVHFDSLGADSARFVWTPIGASDIQVYGDTVFGDNGTMARFHSGAGLGPLPYPGDAYHVPIAAGPPGRLLMAARDGNPTVQRLRMIDVGTMTSVGPAAGFPALLTPGRLEWLGGGYLAIANYGAGVEFIRVTRGDW